MSGNKRHIWNLIIYKATRLVENVRIEMCIPCEANNFPAIRIVCKSFICNIPHSHPISTILGQNMFVITLFPIQLQYSTKPHIAKPVKLLFYIYQSLLFYKASRIIIMALKEIIKFILYRHEFFRAADNSTPKIEAVCYSGMLGSTYKDTWRYNPEDENGHKRTCFFLY